MLRLTAIPLVLYYLSGSLFLQQGDLSLVTDLPAIYSHCKATEDRDMTPFDFITDHLLNIDGVFDRHDNGDEQRPHEPVQFHHQQVQNVFIPKLFIAKPLLVTVTTVKLSDELHDFYHSVFLSFIFRPPVA